MSARVCPVVRTIKEIRGSGMYEDGGEETSANVVKLGGDSSTEYVSDDMTFYMISRKMEFARFELANPDDAACKSKYARMFSNVAGRSYGQVYADIIGMGVKKKFMYKQFVGIIELIGDMEQKIELRVCKEASSGRHVNVSLPDIILLPHIDKLIMYRADVLEDTINKIISYVNKINVNSLLVEPVTCDLPKVQKFDITAPNMSKIITADTSLMLDKMRSVLDQEMEVADYIHKMEKYHCIVINHLNMVYEVCKKIISRLGS